MRATRTSATLSASMPLMMGGGAIALFLGTANPLAHIPLLILVYPACLYILGLRTSRPFLNGWLTGLLGASASLYWIAEAVHDYGYFSWPAAAPCAVILGVYIGLWGGLFAKTVSLLRSVSPLRRCLAAGILWYLMEWARGWFGSGFPWLTLSGGLAAWPELIQCVSLVGEYGLSGVLAGMGCLLAEAILALTGCPPRSLPPAADGRLPPLPPAHRSAPAYIQTYGVRAALRPGLTACLLLAVVAGFGFWRIASFAPVGGEAMGLLLVQGNVRQDVKWDPTFQQSTVDKYLTLSREAMARLPRKPVAIIWPETAMPFFYQDAADLGGRLRSFAREEGVSLIFGGPGYTRTAPDQAVLFNRAFFIRPDGENAGTYDKEHLVPFGEYVPSFLDFSIFKTLFQDIGGFQPGQNNVPFSVPPPKNSHYSPPILTLLKHSTKPAANTVRSSTMSSPKESPKLGMLICYEAIFPEIGRQRVAQGATVLINISNDAWYNRTSAPVQHLQLSLLRAVEQGRWLARATNTGITAFVSPLGVVTPLTANTSSHATPPALSPSSDLASGLFIDGALHHIIQPLTGHTVYFTLHPFLPALAFLALALIVIPSLLKTKSGIAPATRGRSSLTEK